MEKEHREIRALLSSMAPARAAQAVRLVGLPPDEETAVLAVDVHGQSCLQAAALLHVSVDGLAKIRRRAYAKIADDMQGWREPCPIRTRLFSIFPVHFRALQ